MKSASELVKEHRELNKQSTQNNKKSICLKCDATEEECIIPGQLKHRPCAVNRLLSKNPCPRGKF